MLQIPVNEKKQLTFARGLRSILRHDPDIIMVGEIRDRETAEIAVQSALTGHLVLSTVHANGVLDVFGRFAHMGLDTYALVSAINGVWAQRLVRLNCSSCSQDDKPDDGQLARLGLGREQVHGYNFRRGSGCGACRNTGYRGRQAIAEILRVDGDIREMLLARRSMREVRDSAINGQNMRSITDIGLDLVRTGQTTLEEIRRVASSQ
jgi:general secretion pathway protein E